ncbi:hypothetical protein CSKR_101341 [Clonorchis sinensis]|uniref:Uncharacterized protein n=1 Tax=Clonorchis sinensis TaxID=79923 RepID=A0A3R7CPV7_CLOSI|nr:hypothetical protein CSKR_101341 [Clonorchis sinensis]
MKSTDILLYELLLKSGVPVDQEVFRHTLGLIRIGCSPDVILDMLRHLASRTTRTVSRTTDRLIDTPAHNWSQHVGGDSARLSDSTNELRTAPIPHSRSPGEIAQRLERERTDRKVRGSNPASASRLPLSRLGQPGSIPALVLPSGGMAARHRKGATAELFFL